MGIGDQFNNPGKIVQSIVMLVIAFSIMVGALPTLITSIINMSQISNLGFSSFFAANGIILLGLGAAVILGTLGVLGLGKGKR